MAPRAHPDVARQHTHQCVDARAEHVAENEEKQQRAGDLARDLAYLEWTSEGTLRDGTDFRYDGVSVLQSQNEEIGAFRTYYDTAAFLNADKRNK